MNPHTDATPSPRQAQTGSGSGSPGVVWGDGDFLLLLRREHDAPGGEHTLRLLNERALLDEIDSGFPPLTPKSTRRSARSR